MIFLSLSLLLAAPAPPDPASLLSDPTVGAHPLSARGVGMGGAGRAIADGIDALYYNPAGMGMRKHYLIDGDYAWTQSANAHRPGAGIIDSATTVVAAGASYNYEKRFNSGELNMHRVNFSAAYTFGSILGIGATFKYIDAKRLNYGALNAVSTDAPRPEIFPYPAQELKAFTADAGALLTPVSFFSLAVTGHNLIPNPLWPELTPLAMGLGAAVHVAGLEAAADAVIDFTTLKKAEARFHFGAEYAIAGVVPLRAGFIYDRIANDMYWSGGLGFRHPSFGLDFGYRQAIQRPENRTLSFGIQYFMN